MRDMNTGPVPENSVMSKILAVQKDIKAIEKTEDNPYYKSKYFSIDTVVESLRPILNKHGLVVLQPLSEKDGIPCLETIVADPDSTMMSFLTPLPQNPDPQKQGAIITYFRRYALVSLFLLQGEQDDDANSAIEAPRGRYGAKPKEEPASHYERLDYLHKLKTMVQGIGASAKGIQRKRMEEAGKYTAEEIESVFGV